MNGLIDRLIVIFRGQVFGHAHRIVDRRYLADAYNVKAGIFQQRKQVIGRWRNGVIVTVLSSLEIGGGVPEKRTSDNTTDPVFAVQDLPSDLADLIKPVDGNYFFVCSHLKYGIGRRIDYRFSGSKVFFAKLLDYFRAA